MTRDNLVPGEQDGGRGAAEEEVPPAHLRVHPAAGQSRQAQLQHQHPAALLGHRRHGARSLGRHDRLHTRGGLQGRGTLLHQGQYSHLISLAP